MVCRPSQSDGGGHYYAARGAKNDGPQRWHISAIIKNRTTPSAGSINGFARNSNRPISIPGGRFYSKRHSKRSRPSLL